MQEATSSRSTQLSMRKVQNAVKSAQQPIWKRQRALHDVQKDMSLPQSKRAKDDPATGARKGHHSGLTADRSTRHLVLTWQDIELFITDVLQVKENDTDLTKTIKNSILEYLNSKYEDPEVEELISLATMLDPCFRTQYKGSDEIQIIRDPELFEALLKGSGSAEDIVSDAMRPKKTLGSCFKRAVPDKGGQPEKETSEAELNRQ
ncbi:hypothetical protein AOLI_G00133710 [Acnodon oligacanthus]